MTITEVLFSTRLFRLFGFIVDFALFLFRFWLVLFLVLLLGCFSANSPALFHPSIDFIKYFLLDGLSDDTRRKNPAVETLEGSTFFWICHGKGKQRSVFFLSAGRNDIIINKVGFFLKLNFFSYFFIITGVVQIVLFPLINFLNKLVIKALTLMTVRTHFFLSRLVAHK